MPMPSFDARQASFTASHAENSMIHSSHQSMTPNYRKYDNMNGSAITSQVANISGEPPQIYSVSIQVQFACKYVINLPG